MKIFVDGTCTCGVPAIPNFNIYWWSSTSQICQWQNYRLSVVCSLFVCLFVCLSACCFCCLFVCVVSLFVCLFFFVLLHGCSLESLSTSSNEFFRQSCRPVFCAIFVLSVSIILSMYNSVLFCHLMYRQIFLNFYEFRCVCLILNCWWIVFCMPVKWSK